MIRAISLFMTLSVLSLVCADGVSIVSGPEAGTQLTPVKVYDGLGAFAGREFDAAKQIGDNPGALLFVHSMTRNTYPVIRRLDQLAGQHSLMGFKSFTIYLASDRTSAETQLMNRNGLATGGYKFSVTGKFGALKLENPIMLSVEGLDGPGNYALNRRAVLTLVMTLNGKVHRSHTFTDTGEHDVPFIEKWVDEVVGSIPESTSAKQKLRDRRLPEEPEQLRKLAVQFQAFWGQEYRRGYPMLPVIEEITGSLPNPEAALSEVVSARLPDDPEELRSMAIRQAEELFHLQTRLNAALEGKLEYTTMKTAQLRQSMQASPMKTQKSRGTSRLTEKSIKKFETRPAPDSGQAVAQGAPPSDAKLSSLMRSFIRKTNSTQINLEVFKEILSRSQKSSELQKQTVGMFRFLVSGNRKYGNDHARKLVRDFLDIHEKLNSTHDE
ncbi:MAG TPA: hypothetical protein EYQ50_11155 [Verrucomicrobiales bacterium]|nr:hypothetical protein [Verrucomicrobiales bacterium]HIL70140.1 hypothetical protein [Verrucomicrobiota bacterium]